MGMAEAVRTPTPMRYYGLYIVTKDGKYLDIGRRRPLIE
jgi:hypothetical protein